MEIRYGVIRIKKNKNVIIGEIPKRKGVAISFVKREINPSFVMENDQIAERLLVLKTTKDCFWVDNTIYDKIKEKETTKMEYFDNVIDLEKYINNYFTGVSNFIISNGPSNRDIKNYKKYLLHKEILFNGPVVSL